MKKIIKRLAFQVGFLVVVLSLFLVSTAQAASFDCTKATTKVEKMICEDSKLSALDSDMDAAYRQTKSDLHVAPWFEDQQRLWLKHRNACGERACLENSYRQRLGGIGWYAEIDKDPSNMVLGKLPRETYTYKLEVNNDDNVCRHMEKVYNAYFRQPWATHSSGSKAYQSEGLYSFPKYPGVEGFSLSMLDTVYSRRPSSSEFDAIPWRLALRINKTPPNAPPISVCEQYRKENNRGPIGTGADCFYPLLIADFDIDNDGRAETVMKDSFVRDFPPYEHHSNDHYYIFPQGTVDPWQFAYGAEFINQYQKFGTWPRTLSVEIFLARPFILNGMSYLSSYRRWWKDYDPNLPGDLRNFASPDREYMEIFKARGNGQLIPESRFSYTQYQMDLVCRFNMKPFSQQ